MSLNEKLIKHAHTICAKYDILPDFELKKADSTLKDKYRNDIIYESFHNSYEEVKNIYLSKAEFSLDTLLSEENELVPPFILFPSFSPMDFEKDEGKYYLDIWKKWFRRISIEDKIRYCFRYKYPDFWLRLYSVNDTFHKFYKNSRNLLKLEECGYTLSISRRAKYPLD